MDAIVLIYSSTAPIAIRNAVERIHKVLLLEKFNSKLLALPGKTIPTYFFSDVLFSAKYRDCVMLYFGNIAPPGCLLKKSKAIGVFVHGFFKEELWGTLLNDNLRSSIGAITLLINTWVTSKARCIDTLITHSITALKRSGISANNYIIVPQFVFEEEILLYEAFANKIKEKRKKDNKNIKITTYMSTVLSPRLLKLKEIILLKRLIQQYTNKNIEIHLYGVLPDNDKVLLQKYISEGIMYRGILPRYNFLREIALSDLYLETCTDEELRYGAIEAGMLGVPIAKLTKPEYAKLQDYTDNEILLGSTIAELAGKIAEYIERLESLKKCLSTTFKSFLLRKRLWKVATNMLIRWLEEV